MLCSKCGQKISEGAKFCPYCGEKCEKQNLDREPIDREEESRRIAKELAEAEVSYAKTTRKRIAVILGTAVLAIVLLVCATQFINHLLHSYSRLGRWNVERRLDGLSSPSDASAIGQLINEVYPTEMGSARFEIHQELDQKLRQICESEEEYRQFSRLPLYIREALGNKECEADLRKMGLKYKIAGTSLVACNEDFTCYVDPLTVEIDENGSIKCSEEFNLETGDIAQLGYWDVRQQTGKKPTKYLKTLSGGYLFVYEDMVVSDDIIENNSYICFWAPNMTFQIIAKSKGTLSLIDLQSWGASSTGQLLYYFVQETDDKIGRLCSVFIDGSRVGQQDIISENADVSCGAILQGEKLYFASPGGDFVGSHLVVYSPLDKSIQGMSGKAEYRYRLGESTDSSYWEDLAVRKIYGEKDGQKLLIRFRGQGDGDCFDWLTVYDPATGKDAMPCGESLVSITGADSEDNGYKSLDDCFDGKTLYHFHLNDEDEENKTFRLCSVTADDSACHICVDEIPTDIKEYATLDSATEYYQLADWKIDNYIIFDNTFWNGEYSVFDLANGKYKTITKDNGFGDSYTNLLPLEAGTLYCNKKKRDDENLAKYDLWQEQPSAEMIGEESFYRNLVDWYADPFGISFLEADSSSTNVIHVSF